MSWLGAVRAGHPDQPVPLKVFCHRALSVPRAKTSIRFGPVDTAASDEPG